jgi:hypothetical protein
MPPSRIGHFSSTTTSNTSQLVGTPEHREGIVDPGDVIPRN